SFESARDFRRKIATRFGELRLQASLCFFARVFESREFGNVVAAREAPARDVAHLRERAVGVEQIQERRVGRAELTFERVGFGAPKRRELLRVLMKAGRSDVEADEVAASTPGAA